MSRFFVFVCLFACSPLPQSIFGAAIEAAPLCAAACPTEPIDEFSAGAGGWASASWATATAGASLSASNGAMQVPLRFTGNGYEQGYVGRALTQSLAGCGALTIDVTLPESAPAGLGAKVILLLGGQWIEPDSDTALVPGSTISVRAPLAAASQTLPERAAYRNATGFGLKIDGTNVQYDGAVVVDNARLEPTAGGDAAPLRPVGTFGGFIGAKGKDVPTRNGFLTFVADATHALIWPKLASDGGDRVIGRMHFPGASGGTLEFKDWSTVVIHSGTVDATLSRAFPAARYASQAGTFTFETTQVPITWVSNGQVQTTSASASLGTMSEPWLVLGMGGEAPILLTFETRPESAAWSSSGLTVTFSTAMGRVQVMPLFGVLRNASDDAVIEARAWVQRLAAFPVALDESFVVDDARHTVTVRDHYTYEEIADAWGTTPVHIAALPPLTVQAGDHDYPVSFGGDVSRTAVRTWYGPFAFQSGDDAAFTLPLPNGLERVELPVRVVGDPAIDAIRAERDRIVREQVQTEPGTAFLDNDDRTASFLCEGFATETDGSAEQDKARRVAPKLIEHGWLDSSLQTLTEPVTGQTYINQAKYWASNEAFDKEWYTGRQLASLAICSEMIDLDLARGIWPKVTGMYRYYRIFFDWALGSTLSSVYGFTALIDGLYFSWEGMQGVARLARALGDRATYEDAAYRSARQQVAVFMLWHQAEWMRDVDYGIGHISNKKLAPDAVETRAAFDGYTEEFGGATLELNSLWENVAAFAYDVLPQQSFYRDYGIAPKLKTLLFDVTPVLHPSLYDGNVMDPVDQRYYGSANTAAFMAARAQGFHDDPAALFAKYTATDGTAASKQWYTMRWQGVSGPLMLALEKARAPVVEFPLAVARPKSLVYDAQKRELRVSAEALAPEASEMRVVSLDSSAAPKKQALPACPARVVTVSTAR